MGILRFPDCVPFGCTPAAAAAAAHKSQAGSTGMPGPLIENIIIIKVRFRGYHPHICASS